MIPENSTCLDCRKAPATVEMPAIHTFDDKGQLNSSKEALCQACADRRRAATVTISRTPRGYASIGNGLYCRVGKRR